MHTVYFSKAATGITLAGLKQPFCFCSVLSVSIVGEQR